MKLNILGTEYDYAESTAKEDVRLAENYGYYDFSERIIRIESEYNENDPNAISDFDVLKDKVIRHEIIHAFMYESGMREWTEDEKLVDWLAIQFPKMLKAFQEVHCI